MVASALAPKLVKKIGPKFTIAAGIALGAIGLYLISSFVSLPVGFLSILPGMITMGLGMGLSLTPSTEAITSSLPANKQGLASALNDVTRELGTALGVALLGAVFANGYAQAISKHLIGASSSVVEAGQLGIANLLALQQSEVVSQGILLAAKEAFLQGWREAMIVGANILIALIILTILTGSRKEEVKK